MKQVFLSLVLILTSVSVFSQETIKVTPIKLEVTSYDEKSPFNYSKEVDSSFLITISDTNVVLTTEYPKVSKVEYKITETIYFDENIRVLRCKTSSGRELIASYSDSREEYNCVWVVIDFIDAEYKYKCNKN
jgi:hypothetical protein